MDIEQPPVKSYIIHKFYACCPIPSEARQKIVLIGVDQFEVYNSTLAQEVKFVKNGDLNGNDAVYLGGDGYILTILYLPLRDNYLYRVEVVKAPEFPRLKIFSNILKGEHIEKSGYNNIHYTLDDKTKAAFWVGRNNKDFGLNRTSGNGKKDKIEPNFVVNVPLDALITITSPNGNEHWVSGTTNEINWSTKGSIDNVKIEYSIDNGESFIEISASTFNNESFIWNVPFLNSSNCLIKISDTSDDTVYDISDRTFSITDRNQGNVKLLPNPQELVFGAVYGGSVTGSQKIYLNSANGNLTNWTATPSKSWIVVSPSSSKGKGVITVSVDQSRLSIGAYTGTISIVAKNASNSPQEIAVKLLVKDSGNQPFGVFSLPEEGAKVAGAVPFSGWALDDIEVIQVKIFMDTVSKDEYIGDAQFVENARPDVEQAYPNYPMNHRCGWGYMLLTNVLPNSGNGTFKFHAVAVDKEGNQVKLGSKIFTCDNANAVKPFGAIDTPLMGGVASGKSFKNYGWVLTPMPNKIPEDGKSIDVYVDGKKLGNPQFNIYRKDVAVQFPGYANSKGAGASFILDTTPYDNGIHTIEWVVEDSAGNMDGIGSRYFAVQNSGESTSGGSAQALVHSTLKNIADIPVDNTAPLVVLRGYGMGEVTQVIKPGKENNYQLNVQELERIVVEFGASHYFGVDDRAGTSQFTGYLVVGNQLRDLPTGSTLDKKRGVFYWQPGSGYCGVYNFVFIRKNSTGLDFRKHLSIAILPKYPVN